ncbi:MAG TPA: hypothetical protein VG538_11970 [Vicinamibacterales bacterium]|nr:hypothetical protein [Vicinamibacterales bacterium]
MPCSLGSRRLVLFAAACVMASIAYVNAARPASSPPQTSASDPAPQPWDAFRADLTVSHRHVDRDGAPWRGSRAAAMALHVERLRDRSGWHTSIQLRDAAPPQVLTPAGTTRVDSPFQISRVELDDGAEPLLYDRDGHLVHPMDAGALQQAIGFEPERTAASFRAGPTDPRASKRVAATRPDWIDNVIATPDRRDRRRRALTDRYGAPVGRVGRLDRFLARNGRETHEILVDPDASLPVEVNTLHDDALVTHATLAYAPYAGGVLARRLLHAEAAMPDSTAGDRLVTDVEMTHLSVEVRGVE